MVKKFSNKLVGKKELNRYCRFIYFFPTFV